MADTIHTPSLGDLQRLAHDGYVSRVRNGPLEIYTYSPRCVFERHWTPDTMAARGLVYRYDGTLLARPWPKFFNLGERPETEPDQLPTEMPELSQKLDGSLVIVFHDGERWRAITKGSWESTQATWANRWLATEAPCDWFNEDYTYLFELLAPWNRIVVSYPSEEMVLIGMVHTRTGQDTSYWELQLIARELLGVESVDFTVGPWQSIDLADASIKDEEGFVVRWPNGFRVKMKYQSYLALHRIVTGLSVKGIWERLASGQTEMPPDLPDEFTRWYEREKAAITARHDDVANAVDAAWLATDRDRPRKEIAIDWQRHDPIVRGCLFCRLDGKPYENLLWKAARPERSEVFREDVE